MPIMGASPKSRYHAPPPAVRDGQNGGRGQPVLHRSSEAHVIFGGARRTRPVSVQIETNALSPDRVYLRGEGKLAGRARSVRSHFLQRAMRKPTKPKAAFSEAEKARVTSACQRLIDDFLLVIQPTQFNYPVDILGKWHGTKYRFVQRYRSGFPDNLGEEFDAPFARLDWVSRDRFDI